MNYDTKKIFCFVLKTHKFMYYSFSVYYITLYCKKGRILIIKEEIYNIVKKKN